MATIDGVSSFSNSIIFDILGFGSTTESQVAGSKAFANYIVNHHN